MVAMIMMRTLHRDVVRYNSAEASEEEQQEETGWKLIHGEVFRPPQYGSLFSIMVGTGVQVFAMTLLILIFAVLGFLSPANRGGLMTALLLLFVFMGVFAGYYSTRTYKMFKLTEWRKNTLYTALLFPGFFFGVFFILNLVIWGEESSGAVPFGTLVGLLMLWFGISLPLVYIGRYCIVTCTRAHTHCLLCMLWGWSILQFTNQSINRLISPSNERFCLTSQLDLIPMNSNLSVF
jgi:transmembrane 9 superfamily protein 2/4